MKFKFLKGKNFKNFVKIVDIETKNDFEVYDIVKKVLERTEYNHFKQGFDKYTSYSYLFKDFIFPYQFWEDVEEELLKFTHLIPKENIVVEGYHHEHIEITRESFDEWLNKLKIPEEIVVGDTKYDYQPNSVFKALNRKVARVEIGTSGGKTFSTYLYCRYLIENKPFIDEENKQRRILMVVPSQLLAKQLKADFMSYDRLNDGIVTRKISVETIYSGSKKLMDADIVCGTFQSLCNYEEDYFDDFSVMICDELHRARSYSIRNGIYNKLKYCEFYFGMTGTFPKYNSLDYLHIVSMFGPEVLNISATELIERGVANPVNIRSIEINYYEDSVAKENKIKDIRDLIPKDVFGTDKYIAEKEYFHNNNKRTNILSKLLNHYKDNSMILVDTVEYCNILYEQLSRECPDKVFDIIHGKVFGRDEIIRKMKSTDQDYVLIGTFGTMSTGVSIKNLTNIYIVDCGKSEQRIRQSIGRAMRLLEGKSDSNIFDFMDNIKNSSFYSHSMERMKIYKEQKFPITYHKTTLCI